MILGAHPFGGLPHPQVLSQRSESGRSPLYRPHLPGAPKGRAALSRSVTILLQRPLLFPCLRIAVTRGEPALVSIFSKPLSQLTTADLQALSQDRAVENIRLEFKLDVPGKDETLKSYRLLLTPTEGSWLSAQKQTALTVESRTFLESANSPDTSRRSCSGVSMLSALPCSSTFPMPYPVGQRKFLLRAVHVRERCCSTFSKRTKGRVGADQRIQWPLRGVPGRRKRTKTLV